MGILDANGCWLRVNRQFADLLGLSPEQLIGQPWRAVSDVHDVPVAQSWIDRLHAGDVDACHVEMRCLHADGQSRWIEVAGSMIGNGQERVLAVLAQDVTRRHLAETRLLESEAWDRFESGMQSTLRVVAHMVEMRDPYTSGHERRVGVIACDIAREMGWDDSRCSHMELIGLVHDIGKIAIPVEILSKPSHLTELEYALIKTHAERGHAILNTVAFPLPIAEIVYQHHERMDGSGYPRGLRGNQILPEARVLAVADVLESMSSHRPYRPALGVQAALTELCAHSGTKFDANVVSAMLRLITEQNYQLPARDGSCV